MNQNIKTQKGFIQIPLLIGIIIAIILASGITASVVLQKQGKLAPILKILEGENASTTTDPELVKSEENPQEKSQQSEQEEKIKSIETALEPTQQTDDQTYQYKKLLIPQIASVLAYIETSIVYADQLISITNTRINNLSSQISENESVANSIQNPLLKDTIINFVNANYKEDIKNCQAYNNLGEEMKNDNQTLKNEMNNHFNLFLNKSSVSQGEYEAESSGLKDFEKAFLGTIQIEEKAVLDFISYAQRWNEAHLKNLDDMKSYFDSVVSSSGYTQTQINNYYYSVSNPMRQWINDMDRQREIEALQGINYSLQGILNELKY